MRKAVMMAGALLAMHVAPLYSAEPSSVRFNHFDWEIACDNTRTCRAAGYQSEQNEDEDADGQPHLVSVLLVRKAGPHQAVTGELKIIPKEDDATPVRAVEMKINGRSSGYVQLKKDTQGDRGMLGEISTAQANALVAALAKDSVIKFSDGRTIWTLSTHGAAAVLLKMDEFQGRTGTTGALLRKGTKPEDAVLPPLPMPVVLAAAVPKSKEGVDPLAAINRPLLLAELELDKNNSEEFELNGTELSKNKLLVSMVDQDSTGRDSETYWVINRTPPYAPVFVTSDGDGYEHGQIWARSRGRSFFDCGSAQVWTWDGQQFILTWSQESEMCRGFIGGAWEMPEHVASVRTPGAK